MFSDGRFHLDCAMLHVLDRGGPIFAVVKIDIPLFELDAACDFVVHSLPFKGRSEFGLNDVSSICEVVKYALVFVDVSSVDVDLRAGVVLAHDAVDTYTTPSQGDSQPIVLSWTEV